MRYAILFYIIFFALLGWPVIVFTNRVEPVIWGIPFFVLYCYAVGFFGAVGHAIIGWKVIRDPVPLPDDGERGV